MTSTWPDLASASRRVLADYLHGEGFLGPVSSRYCVTEFTMADIVLELSYYIEDAPPRSVNVALGRRPDDGTAQLVGLWSLIPPEDKAQQYALWRFSTTAELEETLARLRDEVLPRFAAPYWRDPSRLAAVLANDMAARLRQHDEALDDRHLASARRAYADGDFQKAVDNYAMVGGELTAADRQRLKIARHRLGAS